MTIEYIEGFDRANTNASMALRGWSHTGTTFGAATGRNGIGSALLGGGGADWNTTRPLPLGAISNRVIGCAMRQLRYDGGYPVFQLFDVAANNIQFRLWRDGNGYLAAQRGNTTVATAASPTWPSGGLGVWHYVECVVQLHQTAGVYQIWVDGVKIVDFTGDTANTANITASRLDLTGYGGSQWEYDDLYVGDTRLGDRRVLSLDMTSDVAVAWTRSTGSNNYANVDDAVWSATDYNEAAAAALRDRFGIASLPVIPTSIDAVALTYSHRKQDTNFRSMRGGIVSGGTTANGVTVSPTFNVDGAQQDVFNTDPNTAAAWTAAGVNALTPFYETVA